MSPAELAQCRAVAFREAAGSLRSYFWILRWAFALLICLALCGLLSRANLPQLLAGNSGLAGVARELTLTLCLLAYAGAVFFAPALIISGFEEHRRRGTLDLLIASPISESRLMLSIAAGRLLAAGSFAVAAAPLLAIPLYLDPSVALKTFATGLVAVALGASLSSAYGLYLASSGDDLHEMT